MRWSLWITLLVLFLSACTPSTSNSDNDLGPTDTPLSPEYPNNGGDASSTSDGSPGLESAPSDLLPEEDPPPGAEFEFRTDFSRHSVPYSEIFSGGPPKDGIPAIDDPMYVSIEKADKWLQPQEPVILVEINGKARAYPIQILMWHEIANDVLGEVPTSHPTL